MYSSGTTGPPKAVVHLHHGLWHFMPPHCPQVVQLTLPDKVFSTSKLFFLVRLQRLPGRTFLVRRAASLRATGTTTTVRGRAWWASGSSRATCFARTGRAGDLLKPSGLWVSPWRSREPCCSTPRGGKRRCWVPETRRAGEARGLRGAARRIPARPWPRGGAAEVRPPAVAFVQVPSVGVLHARTAPHQHRQDPAFPDAGHPPRPARGHPVGVGHHLPWQRKLHVGGTSWRNPRSWCRPRKRTWGWYSSTGPTS